jgi:hypothetical protein
VASFDTIGYVAGFLRTTAPANEILPKDTGIGRHRLRGFNWGGGPCRRRKRSDIRTQLYDLVILIGAPAHPLKVAGVFHAASTPELTNLSSES